MIVVQTDARVNTQSFVQKQPYSPQKSWSATTKKGLVKSRRSDTDIEPIEMSP